MMAMFGWTDPKMRRAVILGKKLSDFNAKSGFMERAEGEKTVATSIACRNGQSARCVSSPAPKSELAAAPLGGAPSVPHISARGHAV
jgi:hypothetical protein